MKRVNNLFEKICSIENLQLADEKARKGKLKQYGVLTHDKNREENLKRLNLMLLQGTYKTSEYKIFKVYEPKERDVYKLSYFPDRITHHAILNVLEPIFYKTFTADTYSCIKGKGIHACSNGIKKAFRDVENTTYCLKLDIKKFYPSINHEILKQLLAKKFKDLKLLALLSEIIDSATGVPIGNYLSQYFANFYLTGFDHWIKEVEQVKYYFRYADDIAIFSNNKEYLHGLLFKIKKYLSENLNLIVKQNYQVFPVAIRGVDMVGYVHFHTHTLLRKSIKKNFARAVAKNKNSASIASYTGWSKHADCKTLTKKLLA